MCLNGAHFTVIYFSYPLNVQPYCNNAVMWNKLFNCLLSKIVENITKTDENDANPAENNVNTAENSINPAEKTVSLAENNVNNSVNEADLPDNGTNPSKNNPKRKQKPQKRKLSSSLSNGEIDDNNLPSSKKTKIAENNTNDEPDTKTIAENNGQGDEKAENSANKLFSSLLKKLPVDNDFVEFSMLEYSSERV